MKSSRVMMVKVMDCHLDFDEILRVEGHLAKTANVLERKFHFTCVHIWTLVQGLQCYTAFSFYVKLLRQLVDSRAVVMCRAGVACDRTYSDDLVPSIAPSAPGSNIVSPGSSGKVSMPHHYPILAVACACIFCQFFLQLYILHFFWASGCWKYWNINTIQEIQCVWLWSW